VFIGWKVVCSVAVYPNTFWVLDVTACIDFEMDV
jgi:hypothetical protein